MRPFPSLLLVLAFTAHIASAQTAPPVEIDEARRSELFRAGKEAFEAGNFGDAATKFREVVAIRSAPKALVALASAEEKLGHFVIARRLSEEALAMAQQASLTEDAALAQEMRDRVARNIGQLQVNIVPAVPDAKTLIDGTEAKALPTGKFEADMGQRIVVVTAPGKKLFQQSLQVVGQSTMVVQVRLEDVAAAELPVVAPGRPVAAPNSTPARPTESSAEANYGPYYLMGGGGALLVTGIVLGSVGHAKTNQAARDAGCDEVGLFSGKLDCPKSIQGTSLEQDVSDRSKSGSTLALTGIIVSSIGGLAVAGGAFWWWQSRSSTEAPTTKAFLVPTASGAYAGYAGRF